MKCGHSESQSSMLSTSVTAVCCLSDSTLISGVGGDVFVWRRRGEEEQVRWRIVKRLRAVLQRTVHGLVFHSSTNRLLIYGANRFTLLSVTCDSHTCHLVPVGVDGECEDWVVDGGWLDDGQQFVLLTAHSKLLLIDALTCLVSATIVSSDRSLLYCGRLVYSDWCRIIVLAGTVHNEVIVWAPHTIRPIASLPGHKGVIFSVRFDEATSRICSTSDDRTCRLWQVELSENNGWEGAKFSVLVTVYAHKARVWDSIFLTNTTYFATIGEDGGVMVWNERGECLSQNWLESGVLCVDSTSAPSTDGYQTHHTLVVGCSDGAITFFPVSLSPVSTRTLEECVDVKEVRVCNDGCVLAYRETGELMMNSQLLKSWKHVYSFTQSTSYRVLGMSPSTRYLATADITGALSIFSLSGGVVEVVIEDKKVDQGRIYSVHWLTDQLLVICGSCGLLTVLLIRLTEERDKRLNIQGRLQLPDCKERWTTCSCLVAPFSTATTTTVHRYLFCGDRMGSVHLYRYTPPHHLQEQETVEKPVETMWRVHGTKGVTCITQTDEGYLLSCGRDGMVRKYLVHHDSLTLLLSIRLTVDWPSAFLFSSSFGHLVVAFHNVYLCLWSLREQRNIVKIKCWGGHRSWHVSLDSDNNLTMVFVKDKTVQLLRKHLHTLALPVPLVGLHSRTINGCVRLHNVYITGSEDTTVRTSCVGNQGTVDNVCQVGSHVSSVRDVVLVPLPPSPTSTRQALVLTVGGRAQIKLWTLSHTGEMCEVSSHMVREEKDLLRDWRSCRPLDLPEVRYMSACVCVSDRAHSHSHLVYTAASDSLIRVFGVRREKPELKLLHSWVVSGENEEENDEPGCRRRCLLKVICLSLHQAFHAQADHLDTLLITSSTDGYLTFYILSSCDSKLTKKRLKRVKFHEGGVNALSVVRVEVDADDGVDVLVVSGGEDARLVVSLFTLTPSTHSLSVVSTLSLSQLHTSQITGVQVEGSYIVSTGLDGRICLIAWTLTKDDGSQHRQKELVCRHITTHRSLIPDIHGLHSSLESEGRSLSVCVFGIGLETVNLPLPS